MGYQRNPIHGRQDHRLIGVRALARVCLGIECQSLKGRMEGLGEDMRGEIDEV